MISEGETFHNQGSEALVLAIHGVGNPKPGEIADSVATNLSEGALTNPVHEINWNQIADKPLSERGNVHVTAIATLARVITNVSLTCPASLRGDQRFSALEAVFRAQQLLFVFADVSIAIAFWTVLVFPPSAFLGALASTAFISDGTAIAYRIEHFGVSLGVPIVSLALFSLFLFFLTSFLQALLTNSLSPVFIGARRSFSLMLRPLLFLCTFPLLFPWRSLATGAWRSRVSLVKVLLVFLAFYASALRLVFLSQYRRTLTVTFGSIVARAAEVCLVTAFAATLIYALGPGLKILMDIFRYAGDPAYRQRIQSLILTKVNAVRNASGSGQDFYILAHSLGSVIAVDALLNFKAFKRADRITLITMGSPLRRFFFRFFPNLFFPDTAALCARQLASRYAAFRWINCYRPFDQIGTKLGLPEIGWASEVCTSQFTRIARAHPDYWNDSTVRRRIVDECGVATFSTAINTEYPPVSSETEVAGRRTALRLVWRVLIGAMVLAPIFGIVVGAKQYFQSARLEDATLAKLQSEGVETYADATYERRPIVWDEYGPEAYESVLTFSYDDFTGLHHNVVLREDETLTSVFDPSQHVVNVSALRDFVVKQRTPFGYPVKVKLKYLSDNPALFYVAQFPPRPSAFSVSFTMILYAVVLILVTGVIAAVTYYVGAVISELFVGQPIFANSFFE